MRAEVRARDAKALCIVKELGCVDQGADDQAVLLDSSAVQNYRGEDSMRRRVAEKTVADLLKFRVELWKPPEKAQTTSRASLGLSALPPPSPASYFHLCQHVENIDICTLC